MVESKILIDIPRGTEINQQFLEDCGHAVLVCHGPDHDDCPLVTEGSCRMAEEAHGIVFMLDPDRPHHLEILERYRTMLKEDVPIGVVVKSMEQAANHSDLLTGLRVWDHEPAAGDLDALVAEVEAADLD